LFLHLVRTGSSTQQLSVPPMLREMEDDPDLKRRVLALSKRSQK